MAEELETWENASPGKIWYKHLDRRGDQTTSVVAPNMKFKISTSDRQFNSDLAASDDLDVFKNGRALPVKILEGNEDAKDIASNPNLLTDADMEELLGGHWKTFESKVGEISNVIALNRMRDLAEAQDVSVSKLRALTARISELSPEVTEIASVPMNAGPGSVDINKPRPTPL